MQSLEGVRENGITWYGTLDSFGDMGDENGEIKTDAQKSLADL